MFPTLLSRGLPPDLPTGAPAADEPPQIKNEMGPTEDGFEVYMGRFGHAQDAPAVWRYMAKDALGNGVAVEQFRDAINEAEQQKQSQ